MCCPTDQEQCSEQHGLTLTGNLTTEAINNAPPISGCGQMNAFVCEPGDFDD